MYSGTRMNYNLPPSPRRHRDCVQPCICFLHFGSLRQKCLLHTKFNLPPKIHSPLHHQILMYVCAAIKALGNKQEEVEEEISV
ncbi:hypothetical protein ALC62_10410 [Cyphomyrmex costatus]|uniref:Uncharacterized protein n=1 Tax=Cyphomyrmex costatus TaxID=456900 RepID=A0A151IDW3_9HYME|nr:hypothetical protein ALC62_10410 [Cyphomyrmex costatus]